MVCVVTWQSVNSPANHKSIAVFKSEAVSSHELVSLMYPRKHLISPGFFGQSEISLITSFNDVAVFPQDPLATSKISSVPNVVQEIDPGLPTLHAFMIAFSASACASHVCPPSVPRKDVVELPPD